MDEVLIAAQEYDDAALASSEANKVQKEKAGVKNQRKHRLLHLMEEEEQRLEREGVEFHGVTLHIDGRQVTFWKDEDVYARIVNEDEFRAWAEQDDSESWFEEKPTIRQDLLNEHVRICLEEGRPLPDGIKVHVEPKLHRNTRSIK